MWWMMTSTKRMTKRTTKAMTIATRRETTEKKTPKITEYPSYPHTSGRMGAMANDSPHRNRNRFIVFFR